MPTNLVPKQLNFVADFSAAITRFLQANDVLISLVAQWKGNSYAIGAEPIENNITDEVLSGNSLNQQFAYLTADQLNRAEGAVEAVQTTVDANRGYLEATRP